jgi:multicomponent Na+:H+ antiporter subunit F
MIHDNPFLHWSAIISIGLLSLALLISLVRLLKGPSLPDRVVAFDAISMMVVCIVSVFAIMVQEPLYLDIIIALALISFLGTIAFAQFIECQLGNKKRGRKDDVE